ncbi:hypothetical protein AVEN_123992-1 [Araneus ventricosus]|uniref:Uncharacterized protein n=1 Tax=Araneus ventricosus TaxID=182803 RepID=A0A4Y2DA47_ARAVE|nr:hypothetical protein AVEN_123992-1 [Araneus ventricosus]
MHNHTYVFQFSFNLRVLRNSLATEGISPFIETELANRERHLNSTRIRVVVFVRSMVVILTDDNGTSTLWETNLINTQLQKQNSANVMTFCHIRIASTPLLGYIQCPKAAGVLSRTGVILSSIVKRSRRQTVF